MNRTIELSIILLSYLFYDCAKREQEKQTAKCGQLKAEESKTDRPFVIIPQKNENHNNCDDDAYNGTERLGLNYVIFRHET